MTNVSWLKKYKPKNLEDLILPDNPTVKKLIYRLFESGEFPQYGLLLQGDGGSGKTTLATMLANKLDWEVYQLDSSGESKSALDTLKKQLSLISLHSDRYLVVGHEISESSESFRNGLREILDEYNERAFFIFTDNNYPKLLKENPWLFNDERVLSLNWDTISKDRVRELCTRILEQENKLTASNITIMNTLIDSHFPSIRKIISQMETHC